MDKTTAQRVVSETFKAAFDPKRYRDFVNELCNGFDESTKQTMQVPDAFAPHVASCQRLGTYRSPEGELADVLVVQLSDAYKLERTRTALRDFVANKLKRSDSYREAALVAFVAPEAESWRFSFVRMEYETRRDPKTGKIRPEERLTPARRYSYLVGAHEECHTAQARLVPLLQNTSQKPTLAQIEEAFSVEKVTREFFDQYAALFQTTYDALESLVKKDATLRSDFKSKNVSTVDFAKKLLGQIVFLYFIQKKGWLGVPKSGDWGDGPRNFLRRLADTAVAGDKCFFNDILEPLFYDTLATDRGAESWCKQFGCRIPFLNGGLFEPLAGYDWKGTEIKLSNALFTNRTITEQGDTGTGILDVFDRYNFTVNEAEPLEKDVAIDPEMLGKVFENLIEENRRKGMGAFYTPREIVHYMCQESLINYLDTALNIRAAALQEGPRKQAPLFGDVKQEQTLLIEKSREEKIPRTDLEALIYEGEQASHYEAARKDGTVSYRRQLPKSIETNARELDNALASITVCDPAIGSGAFPVGMMTEIVRARMALNPYLNGEKERTPYHFKRHAIQTSLYGVDIDPGAVEIAKLRLWLSLVVDEEDVKQIKPLPNLDYKVVVGDSLVGFPFKSSRIQRIERLKAQYFDEPDHNKKVALKREIDAELKATFDGSKSTLGYQVSFDFEITFSEVFHAKRGFDVVIANPPYIQLSKVPETPEWYKLYLKKRFNTSGGRLNTFIFFIHQGRELLARSGNLAFIIPNTILTQEYYAATRELLLTKMALKTVVQYSELPFENAVVENVTLIAINEALPEYKIDILADNIFERSLVSSRQASEFIKNPGHTITVNSDRVADVVFANHKTTLAKFCEVNQAIALKGDRSLSLRDKNPSGKFFKVLDGRNIGRYAVHWDGVYLDYKLDRIHSCKSQDIFLAKEKLFFRRVSQTLMFAYDDQQYFALNTLVVVTLKDSAGIKLKCLLAILNSKLIDYLYRTRFKSTKTVFSEIQARTVKQLPIAEMDVATSDALAQLASRVIAAKKKSNTANTSEIEAQIDLIVYKIYGLSADEIALVEASG